MADQTGLDNIKRPNQVPPDQPDPNTTAETKELQKKAKTPTEQMVDAHAVTVRILTERITYHCDENATLKTQLAAAQSAHQEMHNRINGLIERCARHEAASGVFGWINLLGILVLGGAAAVLSYAGAEPSLTEIQKDRCCTGGAAATACAILIMIVAFIANWWHGSKKSQL